MGLLLVPEELDQDGLVFPGSAEHQLQVGRERNELGRCHGLRQLGHGETPAYPFEAQAGDQGPEAVVVSETQIDRGVVRPGKDRIRFLEDISEQRGIQGHAFLSVLDGVAVAEVEVTVLGAGILQERFFGDKIVEAAVVQAQRRGNPGGKVQAIKKLLRIAGQLGTPLRIGENARAKGVHTSERPGRKRIPESPEEGLPLRVALVVQVLLRVIAARGGNLQGGAPAFQGGVERPHAQQGPGGRGRGRPYLLGRSLEEGFVPIPEAIGQLPLLFLTQGREGKVGGLVGVHHPDGIGQEPFALGREDAAGLGPLEGEY